MPRCSMRDSMNFRCELEFETARMRRSRIALGEPQGQGAPAAAELEDVVTVLDPGARSP